MRRRELSVVMPALVAGIHVLLLSSEDVDGRDKPAMTYSSLRAKRSNPGLGNHMLDCFVALLIAMTGIA